MSVLSLISLMALNADPLYEQLACYLNAHTDLNVAADTNQPWQLRQQQIERGAADIAAVCGAVYVRLRDQPEVAMQLLAAPVMQATRYASKPIYFSDVIVRSDAPYQSFADLQGATWAYNEPGSFSGYSVVCAYLAELGEDASYFRSYLECGSHQEALRQVVVGAADAAAIDSIVLGHALQLNPELGQGLRTITSIGPNPVPPLVVSCRLSATSLEILRAALVAMHTHSMGRDLVQSFGIARFVAVKDNDYDPIRRQLARARSVQFVPTRRT